MKEEQYSEEEKQYLQDLAIRNSYEEMLRKRYERMIKGQKSSEIPFPNLNTPILDCDLSPKTLQFIEKFILVSDFAGKKNSEITIQEIAPRVKNEKHPLKSHQALVTELATLFATAELNQYKIQAGSFQEAIQGSVQLSVSSEVFN